MKTLKLVTIFVLVALFADTLLAQDYKLNEKTLERAEKTIVRTMGSDINTLVESTIFNLLIFKEKYPERNFDRVVEELNKVALNGETQTIRYKAYLTGIYLTDYENFSDISITEKDKPNMYYKMISDRVENRILVMQ